MIKKITLLFLSLWVCGHIHAQENQIAERIAPDIYQVGLGGCNAAFYVGEDGIVVVDAGMTPDDGRHLITAIREISDKPIKYLVLTHYHFDHVGGVQVFPDETQVVAQEGFVTAAKKDGGKLLKGFIDELESQYTIYKEVIDEKSLVLEEEGKMHEADSIRLRLSNYRAFIDSARAVQPVKPDIVFSKSLTLKTGKSKIELKHFEKAHTGHDVVVFFPENECIHVGDLNFGRSFPFIDKASGGSVIGWIKALDELQKISSVTSVMSGHDIPGDMNSLAEMDQLLTDLLDAVNSAIYNDLSLEKTLETIKMEQYAAYPGKDLLEKSIIAIYKELKGQ